MIREKFIDRLRKKYQQGGMYEESQLQTNNSFQEGGLSKWGSFGLKALKAIPKVTRFAGSKALGPLSLMLGAQKAYAPPVTDTATGMNRFTGKQEYTPISQGIPSSWGGDVNVSNVNRDLASAMAPTINQTGGMYDQMQQYQRGGIKDYEKLLEKMGGNLASDTLVVGQSMDQNIANKKANFNYRQANPRGHTSDSLTKYNRKTDQYTTYKVGPKINQTGGMVLPGGEMEPIPGSDAVEFSGATHNQGGIMMDPQTEVEDGETMDQVTVARGGGKRGSKQDYFFSSYLKTGGRTFADAHKEILDNGGNQEDINMLAKMQEQVAGRNPKQVAGLGGMMKYRHGGIHKYQTGGLEEPVKPKMKDFKNSIEYMKARRQYYKDLATWETEQEAVTDTIVAPTDTIVTPSDTTTIPDYLIEDKEEDLTTIEELEEQEEEEETVELKERANDLAKQAKDLGLDLTPYQGSGGGILESQLGSLETAINTAQTNFDNLKSEADELNLKYKENVSPSELTEIIAASQRKQRRGDIKLPGTADIPTNQPSKKYQNMQYYLDDPDLEAVVNTAGFGDEWMNNADPEVLAAAGITNYNDLNNKSKVLAYQKAYNTKYDAGIAEDGALGEETLTTGMISDISANIPEVIIEEPRNKELDTFTLDYIDRQRNRQIGPQDTDIASIIGDDAMKDAVLGEGVTGTGKQKTPGDTTVPWQAYAGMGAGLIPAAYSLFHKQPAAYEADFTPGFTGPVVAERGKLPRLERFDYNQDIANVGREVRGMNKYIETSGGGPANMVNKMMAFGQGQKAKNQIRAAETRANVGVQNTEAQLRQNMELDNMKRAQSASIFNAQMIRAEAARRDQINEANIARKQKRQDDMEFQKYAGMTSLGQSLQIGLGDMLEYKADVDVAKALGSASNEYNKNTMYHMAGWTWDDELKRWNPPA